MNKILVILTATFPYGNGEPFLETESKYWDGWEHVFIFPTYISENKQSEPRELPANSSLHVFKFPNRFKIILYSLLCLFKLDFWIELIIILRKTVKISYLKRFISFSSITEIFTKEIVDYFRKQKMNGSNKNIVFYGYWLLTEAMISVKLKKYFGGIALSRCHGHDLYEFRGDGYLPYRNYLLSNLDAVYVASEDGYKYLSEKYPQYKSKYHVAKLGTNEHPSKQYRFYKGRSFNIVSCSNVIPLKRVELIAEALSKLTVSISWVHFGDGILFNDLKMKASKLPHNIKYKLYGHIKNSDVLKYYQENEVDVFINVSETEGTPVSIMEAISFSIPVIATEVGGNKEIVQNDRNGIILAKDFKIEDLTSAIVNLIDMDKENYLEFRYNAKRIWSERYNATQNYMRFNKILLKYGDLI